MKKSGNDSFSGISNLLLANLANANDLPGLPESSAAFVDVSSPSVIFLLSERFGMNTTFISSLA